MHQFFTSPTFLVAALIVVVSILLGIKDVGRFSLYRARAIARVCFSESIRRRVLLVIPLAILGVLAVSAFTKPIDEQDSIRQILKFCLFASGLLIVVTLIILACTNLPREIENRVIYTIVTKPTTRLEIVIGKVAGFAAVSAVVLLIMGLFTWAYLGVTAMRYHSAISQRLEAGEVGKAERGSLEHYENFGLLTAKRLARASSVMVTSTVPQPGDEVRWFGSLQQGDIIVPFHPDRAALQQIATAPENDPSNPRMVIAVQLQHRPKPSGAASGATTAPTEVVSKPQVQISILNQFGELLTDAQSLGAVSRSLSESGTTTVFVVVPRAHVANIANQGRFYVQVGGESPDTEYGVGPYPVQVAVLSDSGGRVDGGTLLPYGDPIDAGRELVVFRGRQGRGGQQVAGDPSDAAAAATYRFRNVKLAGSDPNVGVEIKVGIEKSSDEDEVDDVLTELEMTFINRSTGAGAGKTAIVRGYPENNRTLFLSVPREAVEGGNFDVVYRSKSRGHFISADSGSLVIVTAREPFVWNLASSLFVLWLMSLLVVIVSIFTSTFLSWPIAVVLTLLILLSKWVLDQLGDALDSSIGNQMVSTMGIKDPSLGTTVSKSVTALTAAFKAVGSILPDISTFSAVQHIEQGLAVPTFVLAQSGITLALFGLPMLALAYVFLRYKEVAP